MEAVRPDVNIATISGIAAGTGNACFTAICKIENFVSYKSLM
jgi:hypothetical protein